MIPERQTQCYEGRLQIRGGQIEVLKIMHAYEGLDKNLFFLD